MERVIMLPAQDANVINAMMGVVRCVQAANDIEQLTKGIQEAGDKSGNHENFRYAANDLKRASELIRNAAGLLGDFQGCYIYPETKENNEE